MQKQITVDGINAPIILVRRRGTRSLKLALKSDGSIRVSVPYGIPEFAATTFVKSKSEWIKANLVVAPIVRNNSHIGKSHRLTIEFSDASRHSTKISSTDIIVRLPVGSIIEDERSQNIIKKACEKALLIEATNLLPQRLDSIATKTKINYKANTIKKLKSRWGACDNHSNITLNSFLIQLDWSLIDYVICHELAHTKFHNHQSEFWNLVAKISPDYKKLRKELKQKPTDVIPTPF